VRRGALLLIACALAACEAGNPRVEAEPAKPAPSAVPPPVPLRAAAERQPEPALSPAANPHPGGSCCGSSECQQAGGGCGCRARGVRCGG